MPLEKMVFSEEDLKRFWSKVIKTKDCWIWSACKNPFGYGTFYLKKLMRAHRVSYEISYGSIPNNLTIDHLCRNTSCVRPEHLEAVTQRENVLRGNSLMAINKKKFFCKRDHPLLGKNIYCRPLRKQRECRICREILRQRWELKQKERI